MNNKLWIVRNNKQRYSDEELISLIKQGKLKANDYIATKEMKHFIQIKDSIYEYYLTGDDKNETL